MTLTRHVQNDFNGDGRSDILWYNDAGQLTVWLGTDTGSFASGFTSDQLITSRMQLFDTGDFNGDGTTDLLEGGPVADNYVMPALGGGGRFTFDWIDGDTKVADGWHVAAIGHFTGSTSDDILWRSDSGFVTDWIGGQFNNIGFKHNDAATTFVPLDWKVAGSGDFNGDGKDDILWRQDTGQMTVWLGTATAFTDNSANASTFVATDWKIVGVGDFNGDGRADILWREDGGQLTDWLGTASGGFIQNSENFSMFVPTDWKVAETGDFNGDGKADILWRDDNGQLTDWLGTATGGFMPNSAHFSEFVATSWHVENSLL